MCVPEFGHHREGEDERDGGGGCAHGWMDG